MLPSTPRGTLLVAVSVVTSVLVILVVILRIVRDVKFKKFGWDEALIIVATIIQLASSGLNIASVPYGNGMHIYEIPDLRKDFDSIELPWVGQPLSVAALFVAKASLAVTLLKLGLGKKFNGIVIGSVVIMMIADIWSVVQIVVGCNPNSDPSGTPCVASTFSVGVAYLQCAANIFIDIVFFAAPEFFLRKTQLNARDRLAIRCLLGFVFAATIMSIVKVVYVRVILISGDVTYNAPPVGAITTAESGLSIIAACLPAVRQLAGQRFPRHYTFWKSHNSSGRHSRTIVASPVYQHRPSYTNDVEKCTPKSQVYVVNDVDLSYEDKDAMESPITPMSGLTRKDISPVSIDPPQVQEDIPETDISVRGPPIAAGPTAVQGLYVQSLQGRLSSKYRALAAQDSGNSMRQTSAMRPWASAALSPIASSPSRSYYSLNTLDTTSTVESYPSLPSSRSSSRSPNSPQQLPSPLVIDSGLILADEQDADLFPRSAAAASEGTKYVVRRRLSMDSNANTSTSIINGPRPNAPYYYENYKIRPSNGQILDQQSSEQPTQLQNHKRTATVESTSWLRMSTFENVDITS